MSVTKKGGQYACYLQQGWLSKLKYWTRTDKLENRASAGIPHFGDPFMAVQVTTNLLISHCSAENVLARDQKTVLAVWICINKNLKTSNFWSKSYLKCLNTFFL